MVNLSQDKRWNLAFFAYLGKRMTDYYFRVVSVWYLISIASINRYICLHTLKARLIRLCLLNKGCANIGLWYGDFMQSQPNNPLHGITLKQLLTDLEAHLGFEAMGEEVNIRCFTHDPSINSSLKFLRKTPWAREKVEALYCQHQAAIEQKKSIYKSS